MKLKTVVTFLIAMNVASISFAQKTGKFGATQEDSLKCIRNLSVYVDFVKQKDYPGAYKHWVIPFDICPKSSLKMYVDGVKIIKNMIADEQFEARKKGLVDTMLLIHDRRIQFFGKEGFVLGRKGYFMYKYDVGLQEAYNTMEKSVQLQGNKSEAATLIYYFGAAVKLEKESKMEKEAVVELFAKCMDIVDYNIKNAKKEKITESYQKAGEFIENKAKPYLSCEAIQGIAEKKYEENKENAEWLGKMAELLDKKDCSELAIFFKVANRLHELQPSHESAKNMGILSLNSKKYEEAKQFFKQAIELIGDQDNATKAEYEFFLAKTYFAQAQYVTSRQHCLNAVKLRAGWGAPYILIGDMYAASYNKCDGKDKDLKAVYWVAVDKYVKAKNTDASVASEANKKIATYSQHFPEKSDAFFHAVNQGDSYTVNCWINETTTARVK